MACGHCGRVGRTAAFPAESGTSSARERATIRSRPTEAAPATESREKPGRALPSSVQVNTEAVCLKLYTPSNLLPLKILRPGCD